MDIDLQYKKPKARGTWVTVDHGTPLIYSMHVTPRVCIFYEGYSLQNYTILIKKKQKIKNT